MTKEEQIAHLMSMVSITPSGCWEWQGARQKPGRNGYLPYGVVQKTKTGSKPMNTHRWSYMLFNGEIAKGKCVMHTCDNPPCCNPEHLKIGTHKQNMEDKAAKGRAPGWPAEMRTPESEARRLKSLAATVAKRRQT